METMAAEASQVAEVAMPAEEAVAVGEAGEVASAVVEVVAMGVARAPYIGT